MANVVYPKGKEAFLSGGINLLSDTIKVALVDTGTYTYSAAHQYFSSVSSAVVGTPVALANKSVTNGVFDADDATFSAVTGNSIEAVVIYKDTGTAATSALIEFVDTGSGGAISVTPNGGSITISWDNGASKIFAL